MNGAGASPEEEDEARFVVDEIERLLPAEGRSYADFAVFSKGLTRRFGDFVAATTGTPRIVSSGNGRRG